MIHKFDPSWGSHLVPLIKCLEKTSGPVIELGIGISSTPLLHALCFDQGRHLISYDNNPVFIEMFKKYRTIGHDVVLVKDWNEILTKPYSVVLVDHKPEERRKIDVKKFENAEYVILHDSEPDKNDLYHYDEIYPLFKYRFDYTKTQVHTTVLSNLYDLDFLHNP